MLEKCTITSYPIPLLQQHRNTKLPDTPANWSKLVCSWFKNQQTSKFLFQVKSYRFLSVKHLNPFLMRVSSLSCICNMYNLKVLLIRFLILSILFIFITSLSRLILGGLCPILVVLSGSPGFGGRFESSTPLTGLGFPRLYRE